MPQLDFGIWLQDVAHYGLQVKGGENATAGGEWRLHSANGPETIPSPIAQTFDAAIAIRDIIKAQLNRKVFIFPVLCFPDMAPDPIIEARAAEGHVTVLWGGDDLIGRLKDLSDNPAESFTGQAVTNNTTAAQTPLTASIHDEATSHDGQEEFTFELRFSENLEGFSYKTLRDNAFTVTGGNVEGARRLDPPSNTKWQIKIRPTSNGDVTIVLPITEDCTADGAVCTGDRKLSNRLEIIVSGPNG